MALFRLFIVRRPFFGEIIEQSGDFGVRGGLIAFEANQIVAAPVDDGSERFALGVDGIHADNGALKVEVFEQELQGGDFAAVFGDATLINDQAVSGRPDVDGGHKTIFPGGRVHRAAVAQHFAVESQVCPLPGVAPGRQKGQRPGAHRLLKIVPVQGAQDPVEGVVTGRALFSQRDDRAQPLFARLAVKFHIPETLCAADDRTQGDEENASQGMTDLPPQPGIGERGKVLMELPQRLRREIR